MTADKTSVEKTEKIDETAEAEATTDVEETPAVEPAEDVDGDGAAPGRLKRFAARVKERWSGKVRPTLVALVVVASLGLLGALFYFSYLPHRDTDAAAAKVAISAASEGTVAVLSYSPDTLDRDFSSAKSHLTGDFLSYYGQFTQQIVAPAAKQKSVKTTAVVLRAALSEFHPNSAIVLLFVNQSTQSADRPEPTLTSSSVLVTLTKADKKWLISSLTPV
jgi:Mce-associated membrane protein